MQVAVRKTIQPNKQQLLNRLSKIEGQVRGVHKMLENDRYCVDILNQIAAVQSAMNKVSLAVMEDHAQHCITRAMKKDSGGEAIVELMDALKRFMK